MNAQLELCESLDEACDRYDNGYYKEKLEQGLIFQDFIAHEFYKRGIVIVGFGSKKYQIQHGENLLGAEIKRDGNFRTTGNLYIEVAEKSHPSKPSYVPSGIMRDDNSWLFVIGDEQTVWMFSTKQLRTVHEKRGWREVKKATSIARLMPIAEADTCCIQKFEFGDN